MTSGADYPDWVKQLAEEEQKLHWKISSEIYCMWYYWSKWERHVHKSFRWMDSRQWHYARESAYKWDYSPLSQWVISNNWKKKNSNALNIQKNDDWYAIELPETYKPTWAKYSFTAPKYKIQRLTFL
jgi:hypothetical protein